MTGRPKKYTDEELIEAVENSELPFCTASELAEQMSVTNSAILKRLKELESDGRIESKRVGSRAKVWYLPDVHASAASSRPSSVSQ